MPDRPEQAGRSELSDRPFLISPLTPRQAAVLSLRARGLTEREIGQRLGIAAGTAQKHLAGARERLGAADTVHAVALAVSYGFIALEESLPAPAPVVPTRAITTERARMILGPAFADQIGAR